MRPPPWLASSCPGSGSRGYWQCWKCQRHLGNLMWLHWQQCLTCCSSRSPGVPRYLLGLYGYLGLWLVSHWWGWWRRWLCQNCGHMYIMKCEGDFHGIPWWQVNCPSIQALFFPHQFSLPRRLCLGGNDQMPGWPWLIWLQHVIWDGDLRLSSLFCAIYIMLV